MNPTGWRPAWPALAASLWMALLGNTALWRELQALGLLAARSGWLLALTLAGILTAALYAILSLAAWRPLLKPVAATLLLLSAAGAHFMWTYHVVIDAGMAANALQTDWHEVRALLTPRLLATLVLGAGLPAWLLWRTPVAFSSWRPQSLRNLLAALGALALALGLALVSFQPLASTMRNHKQLRYLLNPLNSVYALAQSAAGARHGPRPLAPVGRDARLTGPASPPPLLVLVLGETGRSGNFGVNGYARDTTPELARRGVASFRNAWSCGTSTAASVPCMFSPLGREAFLAREGDAENLLDVLQQAGLAVLWIDNQPGGCKGVCDRVTTLDASRTADPRLCPGGECLDGVLLKDLDARLAALPAQRRARGVVLVLHQMGSHGPAYSLRSPAAAKRFLPECTSEHLPDCSAETLRNAYDNSIAYTDQVLAGAIDWIRARRDYAGALLYVADHGESLGENNLYLHGMPYALAPEVQKHVPWITWLSPAFEQRSGVALECLRRRADARLSHDHLFHSVLGLLQVGTAAYRPGLDAYAPCAAH
ncbi:MAG TPA: phosphoethanolamine--lipid A transferase [Ramlibacter sp.]|nr:phosphoethanolamine--lipid A transferase [Ramlibacter sp.]